MSKKNLIAGQSGGPTAAINSSLYGVIREGFNRSEEIEHVYGMINGIQGFLDGRFMDMKEGSTSGRAASRSYLDPRRLSRLLPLQASGIPGGSGLSEAFSEIRGDEHRLVLLYRRQ